MEWEWTPLHVRNVFCWFWIFIVCGLWTLPKVIHLIHPFFSSCTPSQVLLVFFGYFMAWSLWLVVILCRSWQLSDCRSAKTIFPVWRHIYTSRRILLFWSSLFPWFPYSQPPSPKRQSREDKSGKTQLLEEEYFLLFHFHIYHKAETERSHGIRNTGWFVGFLFERYRGELWGKTSSTSSPLRSWLSFAALRKQTQQLPSEPSMFHVGTIKQVTVSSHFSGLSPDTELNYYRG